MLEKKSCIWIIMAIACLMSSAASGSNGQSCRQLIAEDSQHKEIGIVLDWGQGIGLDQANVAIDTGGSPLVLGVQSDGFNFGPYLLTPVFL
jgi:hypothetical protein